MRTLMVFASVFSLILLQGCELTTPDQIHDQTVAALRPYFTNVQVTVDPQNSIIVGYTCTNDIGPKMVEAIGEQVMNLKDLRQLRSLRTWGTFVHSTTYKYFAIGFEKQVIRLNIDTWTTDIVEPGPTYEAGYQAACGTLVSPGYVYIGIFEVAYYTADGSIAKTNVEDTLGFYTPEDFEKWKGQELLYRTNLISDELKAQGYKLLGITLTKVNRISVNVADLQ